MNVLQNYQAGVNLGGWISQYREYDSRHFNNFITKKDIEQIASWGMDHIRLPVDYTILEDDEKPFIYKEEGFEHIDNCIKWCREYRLNIVLDMHKLPGFCFINPDGSTLFDDKAMQERVIKLWQYLTVRYIHERDNILFELINEIVESDSSRWNLLAKRLVDEIRHIDKDRYIIIGGNNYSAVTELKNIDILNDEKIIYNFHFYEPHIFTHQKASWVKASRVFNQELNYPGKFEGLKEFTQKYSEYAYLVEYADETMNRELLKKLLQPAADFINYTRKQLYCGEYGVITNAPMQSRINWHKDFVDIMMKMKIGRACWSYKLMNFGLVDANSHVLSKNLVNIVSNK
jgi:endoglucanase